MTVLERHGVASDEDFDHLDGVLSRRLHIAAESGRRCCATGVELVGLAADDATVPAAARESLAALAPGWAVASTDVDELVDGWIATPGVNIRVASAVDLGGPAVAISYDDAAAILAADHDGRLVVRTVAVTAGEQHPSGGWRVLGSGHGEVAVAAAPERGHRAGCGA